MTELFYTFQGSKQQLDLKVVSIGAYSISLTFGMTEKMKKGYVLNVEKGI